MSELTLQLCRAAFARWRGGEVEFLDLRHSARTAFFLVTTNRTRFLIHCLDPQRIEANVRWSDCDLTIEEEGDQPWYVVSDARAGLRVVCGAVSVGDAPAS